MKPDNRSLNTSPTTATCTICEEKGTYPLKTLSLLTKLPEDMFTAIIPKDAKNGDTGNAILSEDLVKAMRRGSKELQAKYNTTDMIDILYAEATK